MGHRLPSPSLLWLWVVTMILAAALTTITAAAKPTDILGGSTITLLPFSSFNNPKQECTDIHITQAQVNSYIFPKTATSTNATRSFFVEVAPVCPSAKGSLLSLRGFNIKIACRLSTAGTTGTALVVSLEEIIQPGSRPVILATRTLNNFTNARKVTIIININESSSTASLCVDGSLVRETTTSTSQRAVMENVLLGARTEKQTTARAEVLNFFISSSHDNVFSTMPCNTTAAMLRREAQSSNSQATTITAFQQLPPFFSPEYQDDNSRDTFINEDVTFNLSAALEYPQQQLHSSSSSSSSSSPSSLLTLSMQFYGLAEDDCNGEECRNKLMEQTFPISPTSKFNITLTSTVKYPQAGRFTIRARVINSNSNGQLIQQDRHIIVRKIGDIAAVAPCCRTTSLVTAQQLGRPISNTYFRSSLASTSAIGTGWSDENYWNGADLESERLFDFTILAPPLERIIAKGGGEVSPLSLLDKIVSCHQTKLAGPDSPTLYGATPSSRRETQGHNKLLVIVPAGFGWANATQVDCQKHWSGWPSTTTSSAPSPYTVLNNKGEECSTACTKQGTEFFISETGMFDQVNQALITASYGQLSLNSAPLILPEVLIPKQYPSHQYILDYYEAPARTAIAAATKTSYWSYMVLVPAAKHREPPIRAWSAGMAGKNAVIANCYASLYYAMHEFGHRLGFRHAHVYQLALSATGTGAALTRATRRTITAEETADPLGKRTTSNNGYADALDIMSCCRSDYGLYHRLMAGWLSGKNERFVISASSTSSASASASTSSVQRFDAVLWPFDRSESKGNLMSITIRLSPNDILIIGARSASHWPDMALMDPGWNGSPVAPASMRTNIAGVGVWLVRREEVAGKTSGRKVWGDAAMLNMNVLHRDFPGALPTNNGQLARQSEFALLKDGYSWYHPGSKLLLAVEGTKDCLGISGTGTDAYTTVYNYSAKGYYGYRGEWPGRENFRQADYSGFETLKCSKIVIKTGAPPPPKENVEVKVQSIGHSAASCSALSVGLSWPGDVEVSSVVWKDALNNTVWQYTPSKATNSSIAELPVMELTLPPTEYTRPATTRTDTTSPISSPPSCRGSDCPKEPRFYGHILFNDGRHTAVNLVFNNNGIKLGKVTVNTRYYALHQVTTVTEVVDFDGFAPCPTVEASAGRDDNENDDGANGGERDQGEEEEESKLRVYIIGVSIAGGALVALGSSVVLIGQYRKTKKERISIESVRVVMTE